MDKSKLTNLLKKLIESEVKKQIKNSPFLRELVENKINQMLAESYIKNLNSPSIPKILDNRMAPPVKINENNQEKERELLRQKFREKISDGNPMMENIMSDIISNNSNDDAGVDLSHFAIFNKKK